MRVSVVVPAYNEEKFIKECLESLLEQEDPADEIIVVDNNCTDDSVRIAGKPGVRIIGEKRQGLTFARNTGFDAATSEIIARCDADCRAPPFWIKKIKDNFATGVFDALTGPIVYYDLFIKTAAISQFYAKRVKLMVGSDVLIGPNMAITKKIWNKVRLDVCPDDKLVHEDIDLSMNILRAGGKIHKDESLVVDTSARRLGNRSFWIDYPIKFMKTLSRYNYGR